MAQTFVDDELKSDVRAKLNFAAQEINTTRRNWHSAYVGNRCAHIGLDWDLPSGGNSQAEPGSTGAQWVQRTDNESTLWKTGNANTRVTAVIQGQTRPLKVRSGGSVGVDPAGNAGAANWELDYPGFVVFDSNLAPYYPVNQLVFYGGRFYTMGKAYTGVVPTQGTDANWRDVLADASTGNEDTSNTGETSDGAQTSEAFTRIDASSFGDSGAGATGQTWQRTTAIPGYNGSGAAQTQGASNSGAEGAYATLQGFGADNTADRKAWMRYQAVNAGDQVGGCSHGGGSLGVITASTTAWTWAELPEVHKQYDASFRLIGISAGMAVDTVILTTLANNVTPTGRDGFA